MSIRPVSLRVFRGGTPEDSGVRSKPTDDSNFDFEIYFSIDTALIPSSPHVFHFCFNGQSRPLLNGKDSYARLLDSNHFFMEIGGFELHLLQVPWWEKRSIDEWVALLRSSGSGEKAKLALSLQGLHRKSGIWYDGPIVYLNSQGRLLRFVDKGPALSLAMIIDAADEADHDARVASELVEEINEHQDWHLVLSLVNLARTLRESEGKEPDSEVSKWNVEVKDFSIDEMIALAILRKAYPLDDIGVLHCGRQNYKEWPSSFKRLCQNLNLPLYEVSQDEGLVFFPFEKLVNEVSRESDALAVQINRFSSVIPESVLRAT